MNTRVACYILCSIGIFFVWSGSTWYQRLVNNLRITQDERDAARKMVRILRKKEKLLEVEPDCPKIKEQNNTSSGYLNFPQGNLEGSDDLLVIMKTGATEVFEKLPTQALTLLPHVPNFLIFSDFEHTIGDLHVQDALNDTLPQFLSSSDLELYREQQRLLPMGVDPLEAKFPGGWDMDKYKFIPMTIKAFSQNPNAKWYVFTEADSWIIMPSIINFLENLDYTEKIYLGNEAWLGDIQFAHGGSTYILSHAAISHIFEANKVTDLSRKYKSEHQDLCCGDAILAKCMRDLGIKLSAQSWGFQRRPPWDMEFTRHKMCMPILTFHHANAQDINKLWNWERQAAKPGEYLLWSDVFDHFVDPYLVDGRETWDNMGEEERGEEIKISGTRNIRPRRFYQKCRKACTDRADCIQFRTFKKTCKISNRLSLGRLVPILNKEREEYRSGWIMDRVEGLKSVLPCR